MATSAVKLGLANTRQHGKLGVKQRMSQLPDGEDKRGATVGARE